MPTERSQPASTPGELAVSVDTVVDVLLDASEFVDTRDSTALCAVVLGAVMRRAGSDKRPLPRLERIRCIKAGISASAARSLIKVARGIKDIELEDCDASVEALTTLVGGPLGPGLQRLDLSWCSAVDNTVFDAALACPRLHHLRLAGCSSITEFTGWPLLSNGLLRHLDISYAKCLSQPCLAHLISQLLCQLHVLRVAETDVDSTMFAAALSGQAPQGASETQLRELDVSWCDRLSEEGVADVCRASPYLRSLTAKCVPLGDTILSVLASACPALTNLNLDRCGQISDDGLRAVVAGCRRVESVNISWSQEVSDAGLYAVMTGWPHLSQLAATGCKAISAPGILAAVRAASRPASAPTLAPDASGGVAAGSVAVLQLLPARLSSLDLSWVNSVSPELVRTLVGLLPNTTIVDYYGEIAY
jgi:hypothetical protein